MLIFMPATTDEAAFQTAVQIGVARTLSTMLDTCHYFLKVRVIINKVLVILAVYHWTMLVQCVCNVHRAIDHHHCCRINGS